MPYRPAQTFLGGVRIRAVVAIVLVKERGQLHKSQPHDPCPDPRFIPNPSSSRTAQDIQVTGVDANPAMQSYCRAAADAAGLRQSNLNLVVGDVAALPFPDASFDAVVCTLVRDATHGVA